MLCIRIVDWGELAGDLSIKLSLKNEYCQLGCYYNIGSLHEEKGNFATVLKSSICLSGVLQYCQYVGNQNVPGTIIYVNSYRFCQLYLSLKWQKFQALK